MFINGKRFISACCMAEPKRHWDEEESRTVYICSKCDRYNVDLIESSMIRDSKEPYEL